MTPLFANTMATQSMMDDDESYSGEIRATQDAQQFTATLDGKVKIFTHCTCHVLDLQTIKPTNKIVNFLVSASKAPFNWLTGSSLDTFTDYSTVGSETSSSLLFTVGTQDMALRTGLKPKRKPGPGFGRPRAGASTKPAERSRNGWSWIMML